MRTIRVIDFDRIVTALEQNGFPVHRHAPLPDGNGEKFTLRHGGNLNIYPTTRNWLIQGNMMPRERARLTAFMEQRLPKPQKAGSWPHCPRTGQERAMEEADWTEDDAPSARFYLSRKV